jgi:quercetin dioxygenase-like cupin family protein
LRERRARRTPATESAQCSTEYQARVAAEQDPENQLALLAHREENFATAVKKEEINMKRVVLLLAASALAVSYAHAADDLASVAPEHCKLKEDAKVRVIHCILKKGDKVGMHSHPPFVVYFIMGGKSRYTLADGATREVETKNDEAQILPPVSHSGEQLSDVDEILVELKQ